MNSFRVGFRLVMVVLNVYEIRVSGPENGALDRSMEKNAIPLQPCQSYPLRTQTPLACHRHRDCTRGSFRCEARLVLTSRLCTAQKLTHSTPITHTHTHKATRRTRNDRKTDTTEVQLPRRPKENGL